MFRSGLEKRGFKEEALKFFNVLQLFRFCVLVYDFELAMGLVSDPILSITIWSQADLTLEDELTWGRDELGTS